MRMQFFAERRSVGVTEVAAASRRALATSAKNEATTEVPASFMKWRRLNPSPKTGKLPRCSPGQFVSCGMVGLRSVEEKLQLVDERELQVFGLPGQLAAPQECRRLCFFLRRRVARQRVEVEAFGDRGGVGRLPDQARGEGGGGGRGDAEGGRW